MIKTIGGNRLGAGKKMTVHLKEYERSTHDMSYTWRSTMAAGTIVPFCVELALPGDTFDINLDARAKTHPTIGPLFGSYKLQLDMFQCPIRLYHALLHNNALGIGLNMSQVIFPVMNLPAFQRDTTKVNLDNTQINPSCILSYLGVRGVGQHIEGTPYVMRDFNAIPLLCYYEIYKQYYANKQEEVGFCIHVNTTPPATITKFTIKSPGGSPADKDIPVYPDKTQQIPLVKGAWMRITYTGEFKPEHFAVNTNQTWINNGLIPLNKFGIDWVNVGVGIAEATYNFAELTGGYAINYKQKSGSDLNTSKPNLVQFDLKNIDDMREELLKWNNRTAPFSVLGQGLPPYMWLGDAPYGIPNMLSSQEGLCVKTYQSDMFNNWMQTEWIDGPNGINEITRVSTVGDSFTIDALLLARKVYDMMNRIAVSGGTYYDWLDAVYTHERFSRAETPIYCGGLSKELVFQEIVSNTQTESQPLGTLAGKGVMADKHKGGSVIIKVDEPSFIMGLVSLTPRIDYSQGNHWTSGLRTMDDLHKPGLDEIGFQELITENMCWWSTNYNGNTFEWEQRSAGKQPAWLHYMTNVNRTYGNFAIHDNEMFMTLNRRYDFKVGTGNQIEIKDLTSYIDPSKYNFIFAETAIDSQNFWMQIAVDMTARRKMSAKVMPNL